MTARAAALAERVKALREAFDGSFAMPVAAAPEKLAHVLAIRVAGRAYAVRLAEVAGVFVGCPYAPLPGPRPTLLGVAGLRGMLVPVYDLGALLGADRSDARRWWLLAAGPRPVAFAFDGLDGHLRLDRDATVAGRTLLSLPDLVGDLHPGRTP